MCTRYKTLAIIGALYAAGIVATVTGSGVLGAAVFIGALTRIV